MQKRCLQMLCLLFAMLLFTSACGKHDSMDLAEKVEKNEITQVPKTEDVETVVDENHIHSFSKWQITKAVTCEEDGIEASRCDICDMYEERPIIAAGHKEIEDKAIEATCFVEGKTEGSHCEICGTVITEQKTIPKLEHIPVADSGVEATCLVEGKTEGSHCEICETVITEQKTIPKLEHTLVIDAKVEATCTRNGKTEGVHCSECNTTIIPQSVIEKKGHKYDKGVVIVNASCSRSGTIEYSCTVEGCNHKYKEQYELSAYSATELYNQSVKYVGEIITFDRNGNELALGTGFVYDSDGEIVTNYHVIEDAYSAQVNINGRVYKVQSILAYDKEIDLAILKINATGLVAANVCKEQVQTGETVYAIGSSRGLTNTYSQGIITHANREMAGVAYVQHDASITHGNSGGPLINVYGEVVGINTWGISDSQNLNFAIFSNEIDNLVYGSPISFSELNEMNKTPYQKLAAWVVENAVGGSDEGCSFWYSVSDEVSCGITYYYEDYLYISFIDDNKSSMLWSAIVITEGTSRFGCFSMLEDKNTGLVVAEAEGILNAQSYTPNTELSFTEYRGESSIREAMRNLYDLSLAETVRWLCYILDARNIGISMSDLGFTSYEK